MRLNLISTSRTFIAGSKLLFSQKSFQMNSSEKNAKASKIRDFIMKKYKFY